jgi:hypothetical protein
MRSKLFLTAVISLACVAFPYNILGCAGGDDPYDYFTGFFDPRLGNAKELKPFYYTYNFTYDREEPVDQWAVTARDWSGYSGVEASDKEARDLTGNYTHAQLQTIYTMAEKGTQAKLPDSVSGNRLVRQLIRNKDLEAIGYLMYLRKIQPFVTVQDSWTAPPRDSVKMAGWTKNGEKLHAAATKPFFRQRYAYQVMRLNLYNNNPDLALQWYEREAAVKGSASVHELSDALRAGALYKRGDKAQAAYHFCQLFAEGRLKKVSNYYGYHVYTKQVPTGMILGYCKTDKERANVLATIAMGNPAPDLRTLERISRLSPGDPALDMLAVREINKLEEKYLSPRIPPGSPFFQYNLRYSDQDIQDSAAERQVRETADWMAWMTDQKATANPGLYATGAAYLQFMRKDYSSAREWLRKAKEKGVQGDLEDQWRLTELLVTINEQERIDSAFEARILPSLQWLEKKAQRDKKNVGYAVDGPWSRSYRNLFNSIIGPRYRQQGDTARAFLAMGAAENITAAADNGYATLTLDRIRKEMNTGQAMKLEQLMGNRQPSPYEKYLIGRSRFSTRDIQDLIGTTYLREDKWKEAIAWFSKVDPKYYKADPYARYMAANPFADLVLDTHKPTKQDTVKYTKLSFARKMMAWKEQFGQIQDPNKKAMIAYELAKGYYHMSYWGNSWMLVSYDWSGMEGEWRPDASRYWRKEYYEVNQAQEWYRKAHELSTDREVKARALFMVAKCVQKKDKPFYSSYQEYEAFNKARVNYEQATRNNSVFRALKNDYATTKFYRQVLNTCSYLSDFHSGKTGMPGR